MDAMESENLHLSSASFFGRSKWFLNITLLIIFMLGLGIRLYDFTDPPLDFHATRQLHSMLMARGFYYKWFDVPDDDWKREMAIEQLSDIEIIEPPLLEITAALIYRIIGFEQPLVARVLSSLFWLIGGIALYALARDMTSVDGAVIALSFYTFLPFGVVASRSFQPDPLMVMWIVVAWWAFYRWLQSPNWKRTALAGVCASMALFTKNVAIFMLLPAMLATLPVKFGFKSVLRNRQVWGIAALAAILPLGYLLFGLQFLGLEKQFGGRFFPNLLRDPAHYVRWLDQILKIVSFSTFLGGLLGMFLFRKAYQRFFVMGLWFGYVLFGLFFPYHFWTHSYYHLPLIPVIALSLAAMAVPLFRWMPEIKLGLLLQVGIGVVLFFGIVVQMWEVRVILSKDYRHEPPYWQDIGNLVGHDTKVVSLSQDYSERVSYYGWIHPVNWPGANHLKYRELRGARPITFSELFADSTNGMDFFLITRLKELDRQPDLADALYGGYEIYAEGPGYVIFDLRKPLPADITPDD